MRLTECNVCILELNNTKDWHTYSTLKNTHTQEKKPIDHLLKKLKCQNLKVTKETPQIYA